MEWLLPEEQHHKTFKWTRIASSTNVSPLFQANTQQKPSSSLCIHCTLKKVPDMTRLCYMYHWKQLRTTQNMCKVSAVHWSGWHPRFFSSNLLLDHNKLPDIFARCCAVQFIEPMLIKSLPDTFHPLSLFGISCGQSLVTG